MPLTAARADVSDNLSKIRVKSAGAFQDFCLDYDGANVVVTSTCTRYAFAAGMLDVGLISYACSISAIL